MTPAGSGSDTAGPGDGAGAGVADHDGVGGAACPAPPRSSPSVLVTDRSAVPMKLTVLSVLVEAELVLPAASVVAARGDARDHRSADWSCR